MKLPNLPYSDGIGKSQQVKFGGLNHNLGAEDGELWDMQNLTGNYYPLLATRSRRLLYHQTAGTPGGLWSWEKLCWVDGTDFYFDGTVKGTVTEGQKVFASLGVYVIIFPDKAYYNTSTEEFGSLESTWSGDSLTFTNGLLYEEEAECNTLTCEGVDWSAWFSAGDAVTIEGCTVHTENNKTPIIREIDGDKMYFYEYVFTLDGDEGTTEYTETGTLTISRTVPDLDFLCENENRLWGCKDNTIYASKLGDIFNWNVYEGLDTDAYAVNTGSAGNFTGCVSYLGYPIFFKEDHIYKVYGSLPSNFEIMASATLGVSPGSAKSLAIAGETLFYLSRAGIMAYSGGIPQPVGGAFGLERYKNAVAGSDGIRYYVSMEDSEGGHVLAVYNTQQGLWHLEDDTCAIGFAAWGGNLYFLNDGGAIWITGNIQDPPEAEEEGDVAWFAEFGDFTEESPNKKGVSKLQIRLELDAGAWCDVLIRFDTEGDWEQAGKRLTADVKRSYYLPIIPRRGDHYRLRLEGEGACRIYSLVRESYTGSELKSKAGRQ